MTALQLFIAPLVAGICTLWAAWLALAAESETELPKLFAAGRGDAPLPIERTLHLAHLVLVVLAGAAASGAVAWWTYPPVAGLARLLAAAGLVWVVADLLPRIVASIAPDVARPVRKLALRTLPPFAPLLRIIGWVERGAREGLGRATDMDSKLEREMLGGVFALSETIVAEVMTPRIDIVAVDLEMSRAEVTSMLRNSEHARLLVYDGHPDNVAGVLYAKDVLAAGNGESDWTQLIRPAAFVPEGKTLDRQLKDFKRGPSHLAVVVDEFGGTAGIITLEDILEQIVGEIQDEHDTDEVAPVQRLDEHVWRVQGGVGLTELEGLLGHSFDREDVSTAGGLALAAFGRVPRQGERVVLDGFEFYIDQVARRRVRRMTVRRIEPSVIEAGQ